MNNTLENKVADIVYSLGVGDDTATRTARRILTLIKEDEDNPQVLRFQGVRDCSKCGRIYESWGQGCPTCDKEKGQK